MASNFDKQLEKLLKSDPADVVDGLEDDEQEEEEEKPQEMVPVLYEEKNSEIELNNPDLKADYVAARSNMYGLIGDTNSAIKLAMNVAAMSEHPRALEVVANLIKTSSDISKELLALHKSLESKNQKSAEPKGSYTQVNNYNYASEKEDADSILDSLDDSGDTKDEK